MNDLKVTLLVSSRNLHVSEQTWVFLLVVIMQLLIWGVAYKTGASSMNGYA